jgi:hypothetical protein
VQHTTTVVLPVRDARRVSRELRRLGEERDAFFGGLGIHFGRWVLIEEPVTSGFDSWLCFESNFDSELESREEACAAHLRTLEKERSTELARLLEGCAHRGPLASAQVESTAEYQGHPNRDLARIELEAKVHRAALECVSALPAHTSDAAVHAAVRTHVRGILDVERPAPALPDPEKRARLLRQKARPWLTHLHLLAPAIPAVLLSALKEPFDEEYDMQAAAESRGPDREALLLANAASEDRATQNALTHLVPLKKGLIRSFTLRGVHRYLAGVARDYFDHVEMLGGIPSIHFAKWLLIDGGRRLLFFSNYDGSWESYLGDFVDGAAAGLNLAWTCTEGYPRTRLLYAGGANDEQRFKAWARAHQRPTEVFYSAYPRSTVATINNATWIRHGLHRELRGDDLAAWRRRLT